MNGLDFIVTGTGRCGTVSVAKHLSSIGLMCGHETVFHADSLQLAKWRWNHRRLQPSVVSTHELENQTWKETCRWFDPNKMIGDCSLMAAPFLSDPELATTRKVLLVRNLKKVVLSFIEKLNYFSHNDVGHSSHTENNKVIQRFLTSHLRKIDDYDDQFHRTVEYVVGWIEMILNQIDQELFVQRIEDPFLPLNRLLGNDSIDKRPQRYNQLGTYKPNGKLFQKILCAHLSKRFHDLQKRFGYEPIPIAMII